MSESREKREEQIQRMAEAMVRTQAFNKDFAKAIAADMWNAGARIPDPPTPAAPEVVVSEEAVHAAEYSWVRTTRTTEDRLRAAFPHLLTANPWAIDAEIRQRVAKSRIVLSGWIGPDDSPQAHKRALLAALGVTP